MVPKEYGGTKVPVKADSHTMVGLFDKGLWAKVVRLRKAK